jgi:O-antigen ligase
MLMDVNIILTEEFKRKRLNKAFSFFGKILYNTNMLNFGIKKILDFFSQYLVLGIIIMLPLFFGYFSLENNLFELPKMVLFRILTLLLLLTHILKVLLRAVPELSLRGSPARAGLTKQSLFTKYFTASFPLHISQRSPRPEASGLAMTKSEFIIPVVAVIFLFLHSIFLAINPINSIYGLYDRQQGLISLFFYLLFFYLFIRTVITQKINLILNTILFSSLLVSVYGFCQWFGTDFVKWTEPANITHRIFSSLGQPVFLGSFLVLVIPISFYLFFTSKHRPRSIFYFLAIIAQCIALFLTYSLTAWLSLVFGIMLIYGFIIIYYWRSNKNAEEAKLIKKKIILSGCLVLFLASGLLFYGWQKDWMLKNKLAIIGNLQGGSAQSRLMVWRASLSAIKDRPVFGYGLENQAEVLAKYYNQKWAEVEFVNMLPNRAHNIFLDVLLTTGIFGLIIFLGALFYIFKLAYKNYGNGQQTLLSVFLTIAILAFLFSLQFSFLFVTAGVYLAIYIGILFIISNDQRSNLDDAEEDLKLVSNVKSSKTTIVFKIIIFSGITAVFSFLIYNNFNKLIADQYFRSILQSDHDGNFYAQINLYGYIKDTGQINSYYDQQFVLLMNNARQNPAYQKMQFEEVENRAEEIIKKTTNNSFSEKLMKARTYAILSVTDKNNYNNSKKLYEELIIYSPGLPLLYSEIANLCQSQKDYGEAEKYYQELLNSLPSLDSPLLNLDHKRPVMGQKINGLIGLGDVSVEQKKWEEAKEYYVQAQAIDDKYSLVYYKIGRIFYLQHDLKQAIWYNKKASELDPTNYFYPYILALMSKESGDKNEARNYINQALKLNPQAPEVLELSWELGK